MASSQLDSKGVQTDPYVKRNPSKLIESLQFYINAVSKHRLHLFNQYIQSNDSYEHDDLLNVRKEILHRFQLVLNELEQAIGHLQGHSLTDTDVHKILNRPLVKEVIETSLRANLSSTPIQKQLHPNADEWRTYRRILHETREDLHILDFLVHRGISQVDRLVNVTSLYV